jgi:hypothetical protein
VPYIDDDVSRPDRQLQLGRQAATAKPWPDFNGSSRADILWQNFDGTPAVWLMNGSALISGSALSNRGTSWHVLAMGG